MFRFPDGLYVDVRIEETFDTRISFKQKVLEEQKVRNNKGAFVRVFDGQLWYYAALTDLDQIQAQIDALAAMATPNDAILNHPIVAAYEVNKKTILQYEGKSLTNVPIEEKQALIESYLPLLDAEEIIHSMAYYVDNKTIKTIISSKGTQVTFDKQTCGIRIGLQLASGENKDQIGISKAGIFFEDLKHIESYIKEEIAKDIDHLKNAQAIEPGEYQVLFSPLAAGVFTHESFGHKSESDFMVGDAKMKEEWHIGKKIGKDLLTIIDDGTILGNGYVPFDDEGTAGKKTEIIKNGRLTGRLHSTLTAALLEEELTGNARAVHFEFEPIVRMTTTYIEKGDTPLAEIIKSIDEGIFVDTIKHGSGMSTFTIAPARAYKIEKGKIVHPVKAAVVTGNVFETLEEVIAVSSEFELLSFVGGGCGKMEQFPLPVGFGGPYTLVRKLNVA